jgi:hypothetical protein
MSKEHSGKKPSLARLAALTDASAGVSADTPVLRSVTGILKKANVKDYKRHLATKYR